METTEYQTRDGSDPRLAAYAASPLPAWLWSADGARMLWANQAGSGLFGGAAVIGRSFGPADPHRPQGAHLASRPPPGGAIRLERARRLRAAPGALAPRARARLEFADGGTGTLVVAMLSPGELQRLARAGRTAGEAAAFAAAGHPGKPLPESPVHAEIGAAHQPDAAAMDGYARDYEAAATTGEA